ncbi:MAG: PAS domain S-box protein [Acidobacteria bacterium]|nr:PAS domain S-box protein [Acidobacteriota bacterium]
MATEKPNPVWTGMPMKSSGPDGLQQLERRESELWRMALLFLALLGTGLAATSWETLKDLPQQLEGVPGGVLVLVILFAVYVARKRAEINELRAFVSGMQKRSDEPPSEQQLDRLLEIVSKSQQGYRELIDSFDDLVFSISLDGEIRAANRRFAELMNESFPGIVGHRLDEMADLSEGRGREKAEKALPHFQEQRHWQGTLNIRLKKTGEIRFFECVFRAILRDGEVTGISALARDVTQLHLNEARFTNLFETLQEGVYFSTPEGKLLDVNPALVRMLRYSSKEELLGMPVTSLYFQADDRPNLLRELEESAAVREREIHLRRKDGREVICLDTSTAIHDTAGKIVRFQGTLVDITHRREMETRLHQEREFTQRLVASFPDLIVVLDLEGRYTFVSPNIREILGFEPEELLGQKVGERSPQSDSGQMESFFQEMTSGKKGSATVDYHTFHKNGSVRLFRAAASPMYDAQGNITSMIASSRDITEYRRLADQVNQSEKLAAMGQLIAGVAHELNNPLTAILGLSELLEEKSADDATRQQLNRVHEQARRAANIVQDLLVFSRPPAPGRTPIQLNDLVIQTVREMELTLRDNHIAVDILPQTGLPYVTADGNQLVQVFVNLLHNAEQAIHEVREQGTIRIRLGHTDGSVWVTFQDDGPGIPANVLPKIFDPFFTTKRPGKGTGLGLSICLALVKQYGGTVEAQNSPGGGSVFTVRFPASGMPSGEAQKESGARPEKVTLQGRRVLVAEDEEGIRDLVLAGLSSRGIVVECVGNGEEAVKRITDAAQAKTYDVILCDMKMPGLSGLDVLEKIRVAQGTLKQPFILMTGDLLAPAVLEDLTQTGVRLIQKPFRIAELISVLTEEIGKSPK